MIDEELLKDALRDAADSFTPSDDAMNAIRVEGERAPSLRRLHLPAFVHGQSRVKVLSIAAVFVLLVAGISLPLLKGEGGPSQVALNAKSVHVVPLGSNVSGSGSEKLVVSGGSTAPQGVEVTGAISTSTGSALTNAESSEKIESTGTVYLSVNGKHIERTVSTLRRLANHYGGMVNSSRTRLGNGSSRPASGTVVLEVPQNQFSIFLAKVQEVGHEISSSASSVNVTGKYVDLSAEITAAKASRAQYLVIMQKAHTISGILAVQNQLNNIQSQIDQLQGELNVLSHETTYAVVRVHLSQTGVHRHTTTSPSGISKAWHDSVRGFVDGFEWVIKIAGPLLFALIVLALLGLLSRWGWRVQRRRRI